MSTLPPPESIRIAVLIPLKEEFMMFAEYFPPLVDESCFENGIYYYKIDCPFCPVVEMHAAFIGSMGPMITASFVSKAIAKLEPDLVIMMGIAGSIDHNLKLGDIALGTEINNYLTAAAISDKPIKNRKGKSKKKTKSIVEESASNFKSSDFVKALVDNYQVYSPNGWTAFQNEVNRIKNIECISCSEHISKSTRLETGKIASGPLLGKSLRFIKLLKKWDRKYMAIEMEGSGLMQAVHLDTYSPATLILRGISDFADSRKEKFDEDRGKYRNLAMYSCVLLLKTMLADSKFTDCLYEGIFLKLKRDSDRLMLRYREIQILKKAHKKALKLDLKVIYELDNKSKNSLYCEELSEYGDELRKFCSERIFIDIKSNFDSKYLSALVYNFVYEALAAKSNLSMATLQTELKRHSVKKNLRTIVERFRKKHFKLNSDQLSPEIEEQYAQIGKWLT